MINESSTILLVDDSSVARQMLMFTLMEIGFENILQADGAESALKILNEQDVDAIITDYHMGEIDGMQMIQSLREVSRFKGKPIFLLTGEDSEETKKEAKQAGATLILNKSDTATKFKKVLLHYLQR